MTDFNSLLLEPPGSKFAKAISVLKDAKMEDHHEEAFDLARSFTPDDEEIIPQCVQVLDDTSPLVRMFALKVMNMVQVSDRSLFEPLEDSLQNENVFGIMSDLSFKAENDEILSILKRITLETRERVLMQGIFSNKKLTRGRRLGLRFWLLMNFRERLIS